MPSTPKRWNWPVATCLVPILFFLGTAVPSTHGLPTTTIEWAEPVDGHWWDPLRWRDVVTGEPRVPVANDVVSIATWNVTSFSVYVDPLQTGQTVSIRSLTVGSPNSACCDGTTGLALCWAAVVLRGASMAVKDWVVVNPFGVLRSTVNPMDAPDVEGELSVLTSPSTSINGWAQGSMRFVGNVDVNSGAQVTVATLYPNVTLKHTWGNWFVEGNLSIVGQTEFLFYVTLPISRAEDVTASQIKSTYLIVPNYEIVNPGTARSLPLPSSRCYYKLRDSIAVLLFGTYGLELPAFFLYDAVEGYTSNFGVFTAPGREFNLTIGGDRCQVYCEGDSSNAYNPSDPGVTCSTSSSNSFAILLAGSTQNCNCPVGRTGDSCQYFYCPGSPECSGRGTCDGGFQPARCVCPPGWTGFACEIPDCPGEPACSNNGLCKTATTPYCQCKANWTGPAGQPNDCSVPICSNNCTSPENGVCTDADSGVPHCQCFEGWALGPDLDCSLAYARCPGQGLNECSGRGSCNRTSGLCSCPPGWRGVDCSHTDCPGSPDCNHHGECVVNGTTDAVECRCSPGWTGPDCSVAECAVGATECSNHGKCVDVGLDPPRCVCAAGWTGPDCSVALTACASVTNCDVCVAGNGSSKYCTACHGDWRGADCNTPYCLSVNDFSVFPECSGHGSCLAGGAAQPACQCRPGWASGPLNDCFSPTCAAAQGQAECSGHGACSTDLASPACMCDPYFYGNSCSIYEPGCPGFPDECTDSEHGTCVNGTCQCGDNWRGSDCSVVRCPGAEENCNGRGRCDSTVEPAECRCDASWTGPDCATPICPGDCSGNGQCSGNTNPPVCMCLPFWGGADCSESQERGGSSSDQSTTYAAVGGALGGGAVALVVGVVVAYGVFKGLAAYKTYQINKGLNIGQVNFGLDGDDTL